MNDKIRKALLFIAVLLIIGGAGAAAMVNYVNSDRRTIPLVYSNSAVLRETWINYKVQYLEKESLRTIDRQQNDITTSEGQSYTMLRAVYMDDQETFDKSWQWTKDNLQRDDYLISWKFGQHPDGSYGVLTEQGGDNTATDGDSDIALALLLAYSRWSKPDYLWDARPIITAMWANEVVTINGKPVLVANNIEKNSKTQVVVNPSYFSPYAYKIFAQVDPTHDWIGLADSSYALLDQISAAKLGGDSSSGLPPNWVLMNRSNGALVPAEQRGGLDSNYGYDAMRVVFRLGLDYNWYKDPRAKTQLEKYTLLSQKWQSDGRLVPIYAHDGKNMADYEAPAMYGTSMGYFTVINPTVGKQVYQKKLQTLYSPDLQGWARPLSYYDDNWAWFGMALSMDALPNLTVER